MILSKFKIWNIWILGKMTNFKIGQFEKIKIYPIAYGKLAKDVQIYVLKNSTEPFMSKSIFFPE